MRKDRQKGDCPGSIPVIKAKKSRDMNGCERGYGRSQAGICVLASRDMDARAAEHDAREADDETDVGREEVFRHRATGSLQG